MILGNMYRRSQTTLRAPLSCIRYTRPGLLSLLIDLDRVDEEIQVVERLRLRRYVRVTARIDVGAGRRRAPHGTGPSAAEVDVQDLIHESECRAARPLVLLCSCSKSTCQSCTRQSWPPAVPSPRDWDSRPRCRRVHSSAETARPGCRCCSIAWRIYPLRSRRTGSRTRPDWYSGRRSHCSLHQRHSPFRA